MPIENEQPNSSESNKHGFQNSQPPFLTIIAGPNGAGKSTFAESTLGNTLYINGDEIKRITRATTGLRMDQIFA